MKQKKLVIYFISIAVVILASLPILNITTLFLDNNVKSQNFNKQYLFSTDNVEKNINYLFYKVLNISIDKEQVVVGKDNFLFLGNKYNKIIDKAQGTYKYQDKGINNWTNQLKKIQTWYENRGIHFVIVIAPNKHTIYKEKLPEWMSYNGRTITDDIVKSSNIKNINMLDLRSILKESKEDNTLLYPKGDTHWNNIGASIAYDSTIDFINKSYNLNILKVKYKLIDNKKNQSPLSGMLKMKNNPFNHEYNIYKIKTIMHNIKITKININTLRLESKNNIMKNKNIWSNKEAFLIKNKEALENKKLLFLSDSFSATGGTSEIGNSILYNETFDTIWKFHWSQINGERLSDFIHKNKPDVVIYQIAERNLYNYTIIKKL